MRISILLKTVVILLLVFMTSVLSSQSKYSEDELTRFVEVYFQEKQLPRISDSAIQELFKEYNVSPLDYRNYNNNTSKVDQPKIIQLKKSLSKLELQHTKNHNTLLEEVCKKHQLSIKDYISIKDKFQNNIIFQRELKPLVDLYIHKNNDQ